MEGGDKKNILFEVDELPVMGNCRAVKDFLNRHLFLRTWLKLNSLYYCFNILSNQEKLEKICTIGVVFGCLVLILSPSQSDADMPAGALEQRIGNYYVSVKTDPPQPRTDTTVNILLAIGTINGDDISGVPVDITISGDGQVLSSLDRPVAVPYGHYTYQHKFEKPGIYSLDADIYDIYFTGRQVSFTFPINVQSTFFDFGDASETVMSILVPAIIIIVPTICGFLIWHKRKARLRRPAS